MTMPDHHKQKAVSGRITHIFGHRFVVHTAEGDILADVTPKGVEHLTLHIGDDVSLEGEMRPTEMKVERFTRDGRTSVIDHKKHDEDHHPPVDPVLALAGVKTAGFQAVGSPRRKPKHFEVLARRDNVFHELHVEFDGQIRKSKPIAPGDQKWAAEIGSRSV
jgi:hypothetical protein